MKLKMLTVILLACLFVLMIACIPAFRHWDHGSAFTTGPRADSHSLLAPELGGTRARAYSPDTLKLQHDIERYIAEQQPANISVHFEYLPTGQTFEINPMVPHLGMSLLKLPLIMDAYKAAEQNYIDMHQKIILQPEDIDRGYGTLWEKGAGYELTLAHAAELTITESDNTAAKAVSRVLSGSDAGNSSFEALGVSGDAQETDKGRTITAPAYAKFIRCLYTACYLNADDSEKILQLMSRTKVSAVRDKVFSGTPVADKFGVYLPEYGGTMTYSDCGLVYSRRGTYDVCMMATAPTDHADAYIRDITRIINIYL
jgi:hypothetical protein